MPVHGVLIQTEQQIQLVPVVVHGLISDTNGKKNVPTPNDGLISIVGVKAQAAAHKQTGKNITGGCNSLPCGTSYGKGQIIIPRGHTVSPLMTSPFNLWAGPGQTIPTMKLENVFAF